jgi:hypothetical protein
MDLFADPMTEKRPQTPPRTPALILVQKVKAFYEQFGTEVLARLDELYTADIEFRDPVHTLNGCLAVRHYLQGMATSLVHYRIRYLDEVVGPHTAYLTWEMDYAHHKLKGGKIITVRGMTQLKFTDKVYYHEDCYDLGALLYEQLPVLGFATRTLKHRLAG